MDLRGINPRDWQDSVPSRNDEKESFDSPFQSLGLSKLLKKGFKVPLSRPAMNDPFTFNLADTAHISRAFVGISGPPRRCRAVSSCHGQLTATSIPSANHHSAIYPQALEIRCGHLWGHSMTTIIT